MKGTSVFRAGSNGVVFFCIHGAGHSAMSFALLAKEVKNFATLLAFDFKGHGASKNMQNLEDMSIETLINETIQILKLQMHKYP
jgi:protein phosphatase methylesterase 1